MIFIIENYENRRVGEAIEHICLKFLSRDLIKGQKYDVWFTCIVSVTPVLNVGEKFIKGIGNKLFVAAVFQVM